MSRMASLVASAIILLSSMSAQAVPLDFTTSASATWTFSGIQVDVFHPVSAQDIIICCKNGGSDDTGRLSVPGIGTGLAGQSDTQVFSSASLVGNGSVFADGIQTFNISSKEIGWSTLTVDYRFEERGTVPVGTALHATSSILSFGNFAITGQFVAKTEATVETIVPAGQSLDITRITTGTFTKSVFFDTIGSGLGFQFTAVSNVNSVPLPDLLWPTLIGLIGLAWFVVWRRHQERAR